MVSGGKRRVKRGQRGENINKRETLFGRGLHQVERRRGFFLGIEIKSMITDTVYPCASGWGEWGIGKGSLT